MKQKKEFDLGDVLSIITDKVVTRNGINGICKVLSFLVGFPIYTHEIIIYLRPCATYLLNHFKQFRGLDVSGVTDEATGEAWLTEQEQKFGKTVTITRIFGEFKRSDPSETLAALIGDKSRIIKVIY